ncbi:hypothetical protein BGC33_00365, partial [Bathymodiolus thermophilus thioautotrophic gill symbiont]
HKNNKYFLSTDISNFFGSIQSVDVMATIQHNINKGNIAITDIEQYKGRLQKPQCDLGELENSVFFSKK